MTRTGVPRASAQGLLRVSEGVGQDIGVLTDGVGRLTNGPWLG